MKTSGGKTLEFYNIEARRYPEIHARPIQTYTGTWEEEILRRHLAMRGPCLDVGCGEGRTIRTLLRIGAPRVMGLDFSENMLRVAKASIDDPRAAFCRGDAMQLPLANGAFESAVAVTSLNNVPDLARSLREITRVLRPGGKVIVIVINRLELAALARALYYWPFFLWRWARGGVPYQRRTYSRRELLDALPESLRPVEVQGLRLIPDLLPEWPFNFWPIFFPLLRKLLQWLAPLDRWLCHHPSFGRLARFHAVVAIKV